MPVIYKVTNNLNGKAYVGFTKGCPKKRLRTHRREGHGLHEAIKIHGFENFSLEILEENENWKYLVDIREDQLIREHNTLEPNGYNRVKGGAYGSVDGVKVDVYDLDLKFMFTVNSISECGRKFNMPHSMIQAVCTKARHGKASRLKNHYFCYHGDKVRKKVWNTLPGLEAAKNKNLGSKRPNQAEVIRKLNESKKDLKIYEFIHKSGEKFVGTRYDLKNHDSSVSIGELGVLIKGKCKSHKGWTLGK